MYQIFTYVKNKEMELADQPHEVSGMLLYAKTDEDVYPENEYHMSGNKIEVRTLNLDGDFASIKAQLDEIVEKYLNVKAA
jgi:5-methylcytosine-specific restriction enzyme subunit McrC